MQGSPSKLSDLSRNKCPSSSLIQPPVFRGCIVNSAIQMEERREWGHGVLIVSGLNPLALLQSHHLIKRCPLIQNGPPRIYNQASIAPAYNCPHTAAQFITLHASSHMSSYQTSCQYWYTNSRGEGTVPLMFPALHPLVLSGSGVSTISLFPVCSHQFLPWWRWLSTKVSGRVGPQTGSWFLPHRLFIISK